jgi:uncharacterized protein (DUF2267 family)
MTKPTQPQTADETVAAVLQRELEKGLASGVSRRTPQQIRADFHRAREAA